MKRLTTSIFALTLAAGTAMAESHTNAEDAEQNLENAAESTGNAVENAAEATGNAAENAAEATGNAAENAAEATGDALNNAAEATENAANEAAEETADAVDEVQAEAANMDMFDPAQMIRTRDITGGPVYAVDAENGVESFGTQTYDTIGDNWNEIGEIEDVVLSKDGQMRGVVIEIGGFLDIGDKHIFLPLDNVQLVPVDDKSYSIAIGQSEEQLEEMEGLDEGFWN